MIADVILLGLYALASAYARTRIAFAALLLFVLSFATGSFADSFEPWLFHSANAVIFAALTLACNKSVAKVAWLMMFFQYVMAWDAFLFPLSETMLYSIYPFVSLALNIALIISISKTGRGYAGNPSADCNAPADRVFGI